MVFRLDSCNEKAERKMNLISRLICGILAALASPQASQAGQAWAGGSVDYTRVTSDGSEGGCMARLVGTNPADVLPGCGMFWVSFDCDGVSADPVRAYRMLDQAQMAKATGKKVSVLITDDVMFDGYCTAIRIDVRP